MREQEVTSSWSILTPRRLENERDAQCSGRYGVQQHDVSGSKTCVVGLTALFPGPDLVAAQ